MVCERCNKKKATVFYRENIGGRIKALRLCGECAEILEQAGELEDISAAVAGFVSPFFITDDGTYALPFSLPEGGGSKSGGTRRCGVCGATLADMAKSGRVGCANCYGAFAEELEFTIRSAHGRAEHTGRTSAGYRLRMEKAERLAGLKKRLKEAISDERYEAAAGFRDQIRALEAEL